MDDKDQAIPLVFKRAVWGGVLISRDGQKVGEIVRQRRRRFVLSLKGVYFRNGIANTFGGSTGKPFPLFREAKAGAIELLSNPERISPHLQK